MSGWGFFYDTGMPPIVNVMGINNLALASNLMRTRRSFRKQGRRLVMVAIRQ